MLYCAYMYMDLNAALFLLLSSPQNNRWIGAKKKMLSAISTLFFAQEDQHNAGVQNKM